MSTFFSILQRIVTLLLLLCCLIVFLIGTTPGLYTLLWLAKPYLPKTLTFGGLSGRLWDNLHLQTLDYEDKTYAVKLRDAEFSWSALSFLKTHQIDAHFSWQQLNFSPKDKTPGIQTQGQWNIHHNQTTLSAQIHRETLHTTLRLDGQQTSKGLEVQGRWILNEYLKSSITLNLPHFTWKKLNTTQAIDGQLVFEPLDLTQFSPPNMKLNGRLEIALFIHGLLNQPQYAGKIALENGHFEYPELNIDLSSFDAQLTSKNNHWDFLGHLYPLQSSQSINIQGQGQAASGKWTIEGNHVETLNTPSLRLWLTPALKLEMNEGLFTLTGHLLVPEAQITPVTFSNTLQLTDDATFTNDSEKKTPLPLNLHVTLEMGEKVALQLQDIKGLLTGQLILDQTPKTPLTALGVLNLQEGHYQGHGQSFQLKESKLIFSGETINNPRLHVLATRSIQQNKQTAAAMSRLFNFQSNALPDIHSTGQLTVGIEMTGRLRDPKVKLFSSPTRLSDADILSFLLLGKPASEANQSGIALLMSAINAYHLDGTAQGAKIIQNLQNLKSKLAVDIDIQPTQIQEKTSASVGIGKSITENVYIHYSVNPFQENSNVVTLTYLLNKFFSIQVSAGDIGNGIDLLYTHTDP